MAYGLIHPKLPSLTLHRRLRHQGPLGSTSHIVLRYEGILGHHVWGGKGGAKNGWFLFPEKLSSTCRRVDRNSLWQGRPSSFKLSLYVTELESSRCLAHKLSGQIFLPGRLIAYQRSFQRKLFKTWTFCSLLLKFIWLNSFCMKYK